ncbi:MAG: hypothetical protein HY203_10840 [Nitrospirae bacterium]|nr:hypothetical protein [Nitrospirota bacterium]
MYINSNNNPAVYQAAPRTYRQPILDVSYFGDSFEMRIYDKDIALIFMMGIGLLAAQALRKR